MLTLPFVSGAVCTNLLTTLALSIDSWPPLLRATLTIPSATILNILSCKAFVGLAGELTDSNESVDVASSLPSRTLYFAKQRDPKTTILDSFVSVGISRPSGESIEMADRECQ